MPGPPQPFATILQRMESWFATVREHPVTPALSDEVLAARVAAIDLRQPHDLAALSEQVAELLEGGLLHPTHPRYFGLYVPGTSRAGIAADLLTAVYNPQVGGWWHGPAAGTIERAALNYLTRCIGFRDRDAGGTFTTGGSEANFTAVLAALHSALPESVREGLIGLSRRPLVYLSDQAHDSFVKIVRAAGLGEASLRRISSDARQRMQISALREQIARDRKEGDQPFLVVATAGTTAAGAIDPLPEIAALCRGEKLWMHVDAAWGGFALLSPRLRPHLQGIELSDSVTWDAHKTLPVPMGAGMFFCRSISSLAPLFNVQTGYVPQEVSGRIDLYRYSVQWSRRFIGLKVFLFLAEHGEAGVAAMLDHQAAMAGQLREELRARGWQIMNDSPLAVVCFSRRDLPPGSTAEIARLVAEEGMAWISEARMPGGERWLRACITHRDVQAADLTILAGALDRALAKCTMAAAGS